MCRVYRVTRAGYYAWQSRVKSAHEKRDEFLLRKTRTIFRRSRGTYGSPRITQALRLEGINVGEKRIERIMRDNNIKARCAKIYRRMPGTHRFFNRTPNRQRKKIIKRPNQVWVGDVTYLRCGSKVYFMAAVLDKCSRRVLSWAISNKRDVALTLKALNRAVRARELKPGLIFHTDRGSEFGASAFRNRLAELSIVQSMNRPRRMNDNARMESFFHSFKADGFHGAKLSSLAELRQLIRSYVPFYNHKRLHSALGYISPVQFELNLC